MQRHLHFKDEKSDKFWKIEVSGNSHTVTYGRTGSAGMSKIKTFENNTLALEAAEKLVNSKIKKGYVDIEVAAAKPIKLENKPTVQYVHGEPFDVHTMAPKISADPHSGEDKSWDEKLSEYLLVQDASATTHFVVGIAGEAYEEPNTNIVLKSLVKNKTALPNLQSLYLNDIESEECELSWIVEGDLTPVWKHFPNLIEFTVRGYPGEMGKISMPMLKRFTVECSGMNKKNLQQIFAADMPNLTHLELWLGTSEYGGETEVGDLEPLLSGKLFPNLKYLGLRNCDYADALAQAVANAPILDRIETLDMSLGTMGDEGGIALYNSDKVRSTQHLDLHHHFMSDWMVGRFMGVDKPTPVVNSPAKVEAPTAQPAQSGGFLSKIFGKSETSVPPPVQDEKEGPKSKIDYASVPLITVGQFGPTVNLDNQEDPEAYDGEEWRYVAFGE